MKATYEDDLRRFRVPSNLNFEGFQELIRTRFDLKGDFKLKWADEDGDLITFSSDEELRDATASPGILRVTVLPVTPSGASKNASVENLDEQKLMTLVQEACQTLEIPFSEATKYINGFDLTKLQQLRDTYGPFPQWLSKKPILCGWLKNFFTTGGAPGCPFFPGSEENEGEAIHRGVQCDGCNVSPIRGTRYKSTTKFNYDLCKTCKDSGKYDENEYEEMTQPQRMPWGGPWGGRRCGPARRGFGWGGRGPFAARGPWAGKCRGAGLQLSSRFVRDVSVWDGTEVAPTESFVKIWKLRNDGTEAWPETAALIHVGGDPLGSDRRPVVVGAVAPGAEVDVSVDCISPERPGRYVGFWRLSANGKDCGFRNGGRFGQRIWAQIQVVPRADMAKDASEPEETAAVDQSAAEAAEVAREERSTVEKAEDGARAAAETVAKPFEDLMKQMQQSGAMEQVQGEVQNFLSALNGGLNGGGQVDGDVQNLMSGLGNGIQSLFQGFAQAAAAASDTQVEPEPEAEATNEAVAPGEVEAPASPAAAPEYPDLGAEPADLPEGTVLVSAEEPDPRESMVREIMAMGFEDRALVEEVLTSNKDNVERTIQALVQLQEWDPMLEELQEMGFDNAGMNKRVLLENGGSIDRTILTLCKMKKEKSQ